MSKRKRYSPEYKREIVELVRRSKSSCRQVALEVGVNHKLPVRQLDRVLKASFETLPLSRCVGDGRLPWRLRFRRTGCRDGIARAAGHRGERTSS